MEESESGDVGKLLKVFKPKTTFEKLEIKLHAYKKEVLETYYEKATERVRREGLKYEKLMRLYASSIDPSEFYKIHHIMPKEEKSKPMEPSMSAGELLKRVTGEKKSPKSKSPKHRPATTKISYDEIYKEVEKTISFDRVPISSYMCFSHGEDINIIDPNGSVDVSDMDLHITMNHELCCLVVKCPYNESFVKDIKNKISPSMRSWVPSDKVWHIDMSQGKKLEVLGKNYFKNVKFISSQKNKGHEFDILIKKLTPEGKKILYRALSKLYHPDVPGTGDKDIMSLINKIFS